MDLINQLRYKAKLKDAKVVLPESDDIRTLKAAAFLSEEKICQVYLIGDEQLIKGKAKKEKLKLPNTITYINFATDTQKELLTEAFFEKRQHKGLLRENATQILTDSPLFYAASLVDAGIVDGCVAGAVNTTGDVLRAAIQVIGLKPDSAIISSVFLMHTLDERVLTYGDCAVVPYPDANQLATIASDSADTHLALTGEDPKVAMLSFSTKGSAKHESVDKVIDALEKVKNNRPDLTVDGEMQFDTAYLPTVGSRKAPDSEVAGRANVYIFPNIDAGNIGYKITERLGGATAIGPIIQGLAKPMNDLSRGCNWEDIVNTVAVTVLQG